jgi:hypothetical protein
LGAGRVDAGVAQEAEDPLPPGLAVLATDYHPPGPQGAHGSRQPGEPRAEIGHDEDPHLRRMVAKGGADRLGGEPERLVFDDVGAEQDGA